MGYWLLPATAETSGPGPSFSPCPRRQHENGNVAIIADQLDQAIGSAAVQDDEFGNDARQIVGDFGGFIKQVLGFLVRLVAHDLLHAAPLLKVRGFGDAEKRDPALGVLRAARGETQRHAAFRRAVDHDKEFARPRRNGAFAGIGSLAHGAMLTQPVIPGERCECNARESTPTPSLRRGPELFARDLRQSRFLPNLFRKTNWIASQSYALLSRAMTKGG